MAIAITRTIGWILFFFTALEAFSDEQATHNVVFESTFQPWFTGPLITASGYTIDSGHMNVQPYVSILANIGFYSPRWHRINTSNFYTTTLIIPTKIGLCQWMDFQVAPQASYNATQGVQDFVFGDLPIGMNIQLIRPKLKDPWPAVKLGFRATIPTGKYQRLSMSKLLTDSGGTGNWEPGVILGISKLWHLYETHFMEARLAMSYRFGAPVSVRGFNVYGGAPDTRGTVYPGNQFSIAGAIQYNFNQRWAFACDGLYMHVDRTTFSGYGGTLSDQSPANVSALSTEQFSLAPALEYSLNKNLGFIAGTWFSIAGRNSTQFISGILSFNAYL